METFKKNAVILSGSFIIVVSSAFLLLFLAASNIIKSKQEELLLLEREDEILQIENDFEDVSLYLGQVKNYLLTETDQTNLLPFLTQIDQESDYITSIYLGRADNTMVNSSGFIPPLGFDLRERPWYQMALASNALIYTPAFINATQDKIIISMAIPVYVEETLIGVVAADIDTKAITGEILLHRIGEGGYVFFLDGNGNFLSFPNMDQEEISLVPANSVFLDFPTVAEDEIAINYSIQGIKGAIAYRVMSHNNFTLGVFLPMNEFLAVNVTFFWTFFILGFIFSTYGIFLIFGFITKVSKPLTELVVQINNIDITKDITYKLPITEKSGFIKVRKAINNVLNLAEKEFNQIEYIANHDFLTDLYNRHFFIEKYSQLDEAKYYPLGIMMIDINGLKIINDAYGHAIGDIAIKKVVEIFKHTFNENDFVARIGGDEFVALFPNTTLEKMQEIKEGLKENSEKYPFNNIVLSLAVGYEAKTDQKTTLDEILEQAENHMYRHKTTEGTSSRNRTISAILATLTEKFSIEKEHLENVSKTCGKVGKELNLTHEEIKELEQAGMFHDIGKISVPDFILNKMSKLTPEEYEIMKTHPEAGYQILRAADEYSDLATHALYHHERWDGTGYPKGLKGLQIPLFSRIIGVVDAYEAMRANRLYRKKMSKDYAVSEIIKYSGTQFDPKIAKIFIEKVLKAKWK